LTVSVRLLFISFTEDDPIGVESALNVYLCINELFSIIPNKQI